MAAVSDQPHERECAVCTNDFNTPKILPCGHLLCRECVVSWMDSKPDASCPLCRCAIIDKQDHSGSLTASIVDSLPTDYVMEALVESARVLVKDPTCHVCEDVKADFICRQCREMQCSACSNIHKKQRATRTHNVESLSTVTAERLAAGHPALCVDHSDKEADFFCQDHSLAVCKACKSKKHRECSEVKDIEDEAESAQNALNDLMKILIEAEKNIEQALGQLDSRLQEVDRSEQNDLAQVDKTCDRFQKLVRDVCIKLKEKSRASHLQVRNSLQDVRTTLANRLGKVTSHKHIVTRASAVAPRPALIYAKKALADRVKSLDLSADLEAAVWTHPSTSAKCCEDVVTATEKTLLTLEQNKSEPEKQLLTFHAKTGTITALKSDKLVETEEEPGLFNVRSAAVATCKPLVPNVLYEMSPGSLYFGVTGESQSKNEILSKAFKLSTRQQLDMEGSVAGLMIDSSNNLHFYLDGQKLETETKNVPRPCYAAFTLSPYLKMTVLPVARGK